MNDDEKVVREAWDAEIAIEDHRACCATNEWRLVIVDIFTHWNESPPAAWSAARAFTDERKRQIAEIEEEIGYVMNSTCKVPGCPSHKCAAYRRILASRIAARDELTKGMRRTQ